MKKIYILLFLCIAMAAKSQSVSDVFKTMPADLLPGFSDANKTMLVVDTDKTVIRYALGEVEKTRHTQSFLSLKTSEAGTTQIKLLPLSADSNVVCLIKTVCASVCDSHISFYTTNWEKLNSNDYLPTLSVESFLDSAKKGTDNYKYAVSLPDISPIKAEFVNGQTDLLLTFDYKSYLSDDIIAQLQPFLKSDSIHLKWNNSRFR